MATALSSSGPQVMTVHGGVTEQDVLDEVSAAAKLAEKNFTEHNVKTTILFLDEANTSLIALWSLNEMVMDRTLKGKPIEAIEKFGLRLVIACNPYKEQQKKAMEEQV